MSSNNGNTQQDDSSQASRGPMIFFIPGGQGNGSSTVDAIMSILGPRIEADAEILRRRAAARQASATGNIETPADSQTAATATNDGETEAGATGKDSTENGGK